MNRPMSKPGMAAPLSAERSMRLYKYVAADRIDVLLNGVIRFTQAAEFNDPFEVVPYVAAVLPPGHEDEYLSQSGSDSQRILEGAIDRALAVQGLPPQVAALTRDSALRLVRGTDVDRVVKVLLPHIVEHLKPTFGRHFQKRARLRKVSGDVTS
jgi:hypothetical protein